jgi:hypothetical protein
VVKRASEDEWDHNPERCQSHGLRRNWDFVQENPLENFPTRDVIIKTSLWQLSTRTQAAEIGQQATTVTQTGDDGGLAQDAVGHGLVHFFFCYDLLLAPDFGG